MITAVIELALALVVAAGAAVPPQPGPDVRALLKNIEKDDERAVMMAAQELTRIGPPVVPDLVQALEKQKGCQAQWVASGILYRIEPKHDGVNAALLRLVTGDCKGRSERALIMRRQAGFALVGKPEGIPIMAGLLTTKDLFTRQTAAFAFDDLTERLEGRPPAVEASPDVLNATTKALTGLTQALADKDRVVRCMSYEALEQAARSKQPSLRSAAAAALAGQNPACSR